MARLAPFIKQQFFGDNGEPLAGGKIHTYISGTSTPLVTYTDQTGNVANTNPIVLDSNGEASIWLSDAYYKFIIKDANDVTLRTVDKVSVTNDTTAEAASAKEAAEIAQAAAELAETNAEAYALASAASAADASASETNAEASASSAAGFASDAESARDAAIIARDEAEGFVTDAQFYASLSANNNDEAYNNATLAQEWAIKTTATVDGSDYSAKEWAKGTLTRGAASGGSSKDWANYTGDTVDDTEYSAKKYALDAAQSASDAAQSALDAAGASSNPVVGFTAGSVVFSVGSNAAGEDNSNFFWDDTNKLFGIGTNTPNTVGSTGRKNLVIAGSTNAGLTIKAGTAHSAAINFTDTDGANQGLIAYATDTDYMAFYTGSTTAERMRIDSSGDVGVGSSATNRLKFSYNGGTGIATVGPDSSGGSTQLLLGTSLSGTFAEKMRINSSGNVGIGTTNPNSNHVVKFLHVSDATSAGVVLEGPRKFSIYSNSGSGLSITDENAASARLVITSNGTVLIGTTTAPSSGGDVGLSLNTGGAPLIRSARSGTASEAHVQFFNGNGVVGAISTSGSSTTYATSSDYRLKENIQPMTDALSKVAQLKPVTYTWKADGTSGHGFIAHELQAVIPDAVTGEKDAVDAEGNPKYQGIDPSKIVATLTAALQELNAKVEILENKLQTPNVGGPA